MAKQKIHELAKELKLTNKVIVDLTHSTANKTASRMETGTNSQASAQTGSAGSVPSVRRNVRIFRSAQTQTGQTTTVLLHMCRMTRL